MLWRHVAAYVRFTWVSIWHWTGNLIVPAAAPKKRFNIHLSFGKQSRPAKSSPWTPCFINILNLADSSGHIRDFRTVQHQFWSRYIFKFGTYWNWTKFAMSVYSFYGEDLSLAGVAYKIRAYLFAVKTGLSRKTQISSLQQRRLETPLFTAWKTDRPASTLGHCKAGQQLQRFFRKTKIENTRDDTIEGPCSAPFYSQDSQVSGKLSPNFNWILLGKKQRVARKLNIYNGWFCSGRMCPAAPLSFLVHQQ